MMTLYLSTTSLLANRLIEIVGWVGTVTYLIAYALVSLKKAAGDSVLYQGMNIFAGILLVIYSLHLKAYAATGLNAVGAIISLSTLGRKWLIRSHRRGAS